MAPEFLENKIFTEKSDIYSFGIFLYEVFCCAEQSNPYGEMQGVQIMFQVTNNNLRPQITKKMEVSIDSKILSIMKTCWDKQVHLRPSAKELIK